MIYMYDTYTNEQLGEFKSMWHCFMESDKYNTLGAVWNDLNRKRKFFKRDFYLAYEPIPHVIYEYKGRKYLNRSECARVNNIQRYHNDIKEVEVGYDCKI